MIPLYLANQVSRTRYVQKDMGVGDESEMVLDPAFM